MSGKMQMSDGWFTVLVIVHGTEPVAPGQPYADWMNTLRSTIGAGGIAFSEDRPWTVGDHRNWTKDWVGQYRRDDTPYANVWQQIHGVGSLAMGYVWAAIHLVDPLEEAGYVIRSVNVQRTQDMVLLA